MFSFATKCSVADLIEFIGANSAAATTVSIPTHAAGDLIIILANRSTSATPPTLPIGWTNIQSGSVDSESLRVGYKIAASSSETSGTWTNATSLGVVVYRNAAVGASATTLNTTGTTVNWPALTLQDGSGKSWVAGFAFIQNANSDNTIPSGYTKRIRAHTNTVIWDTNSGVSSFVGATSTQQDSGVDNRTVTVEIKKL